MQASVLEIVCCLTAIFYCSEAKPLAVQKFVLRELCAMRRQPEQAGHREFHTYSNPVALKAQPLRTPNYCWQRGRAARTTRWTLPEPQVLISFALGPSGTHFFPRKSSGAETGSSSNPCTQT
jgi:hypothetical protein